MNEAFIPFTIFNMGRTENFGEDNHFSVLLWILFTLFKMLFSVSPEFMFMFNLKLVALDSTQTVVLVVHDLMCSWQVVSLLWASAASSVRWGVGLFCQLWLLSDLAHLAAGQDLLFTFVLLLEGFLLISFLFSESRLALSLSILLWTSGYIHPYDLLFTKGLDPP